MENIIVQISSGQGPEECCRAVFHIKNRLEHYLAGADCTCQVIQAVKGEEKRTFQSVLISVTGNCLEEKLKDWNGTVQWMATSPFRPKHKRKNWFVGIATWQPLGTQQWETRDFLYETCRSGGPGGQNVNKVESAVRAIHPATGIAVQVSDKRTQMENKKIATERLLSKLERLNKDQILQYQLTQWAQNKQLERGNPIRIFKEPL